jgi:hypothetical protein
MIGSLIDYWTSISMDTTLSSSGTSLDGVGVSLVRLANEGVHSTNATYTG